MQRVGSLVTALGLASAFAPPLVTRVAAQESFRDERSLPVTESIEEPVGSNAPQMPPEFHEAAGNQLAQHLPEIADRMFPSIGVQAIQALTDSGLSHADSEAIAQRYASAFADCATATFMSEAERQSISLGELLGRLIEVTYIGNVDLSDPGFDPIQNVSKVMDFYSMSANLESCAVGAMQEAGISYQSGVEALSELTGDDRVGER